MKIALLSDPHFITRHTPEGRTDNTEKTSRKKFTFVINYCGKRRIPLLIAGDLSDTPRSWYSLTSIATILRSAEMKWGELKVYSVYGQHDLYARDTKKQTVLGALSATGTIRILGRKRIKLAKNVHVYGASYKDRKWKESIPLPEKISRKVKNVLVIHAPITKTEVPYDYFEARRFLKTHKAYHLILCGDIHKKFFIVSDNRFIINTGPMIRKEASEEMFNHFPCFFVWDTEHDSFDKIQFPHLPAAKVLTREHIESEKRINDVLEGFVEGFKKGLRIRHKKVSNTFNTWAKENNINEKLRRNVFRRLKEVEDDYDRATDRTARSI